MQEEDAGGWCSAPTVSRVHGSMEALQPLFLLLLASLQERGYGGQRLQLRGLGKGRDSHHIALTAGP